ncbi:MAG: AAA family ATPase [Pseudomonadota bacterium]
MGVKNYLIDGISGTGKTTVAEELEKRGYHVVHGDRTLKLRGDPKTSQPIDEPIHKNEHEKAEWRQKHHIWDLDKVNAVMNDQEIPVSFFCGGSRNSDQFIKNLNEVFILEVDDINEIFRRMDERVARDPTDFGGKPEEKEMVAHLHKTKGGIPKDGIRIDSTRPLNIVVDEILEHCDLS